MEIPSKMGPLESQLSRSLKLIVRTVTDRSANYDFLLVIRGNHGCISYRFRDKRRLRSKIAKFSHPVYFMLPLRVPLGFCNVAGARKTTV